MPGGRKGCSEPCSGLPAGQAHLPGGACRCVLQALSLGKVAAEAGAGQGGPAKFNMALRQTRLCPGEAPHCRGCAEGTQRGEGWAAWNTTASCQLDTLQGRVAGRAERNVKHSPLLFFHVIIFARVHSQFPCTHTGFALCTACSCARAAPAQAPAGSSPSQQSHHTSQAWSHLAVPLSSPSCTPSTKV